MNVLKLLAINTIIALFPEITFCQNSNTDIKYEALKKQDVTNAQFIENYNKGIEHYNKAVTMIRKEHDRNIDELQSLQKEVTDELKLAKPYLEKAHNILPDNEDALKGLYGISFGLNDKESSEKYKKELEALKQKK